MTILQSILTALFCMAVVFIVLIALWVIIRLSTAVIKIIQKNSSQPTAGGQNLK